MIKGTAAQDVLLSRERNPKKIAVYAVAGIALVTGLSIAIPHYSQVFTADLMMPENSLRLSKVRRGELTREIISQGRIVAANSPTLFSPEQGFIDLKVKAGDTVNRGQILAVTLSPDLNELLAQEKSNLARMQVELERQKIQAKRRKLELQQAEDLARVNLKAMDREKRRADEAIEIDLISRLDYEKSRDELDRAELEYAQAIQNNRLEQESLDFDGRTLTLQAESQQLLVDGLQRRVNGLTVISPVDGMVGNIQVEQRQAVAANQPLITVVDLTAFEVEATVSEGYADDLAPLMDAEISLNGKTYAGQLTAISPEVVNGQVITRIRFSNSVPENLRQNQRLTARILLENKNNVLMVDRGSFVDNFDGTIFKREGNRAIRVPVVLGSTSLRHVEILDGLNTDDVVIVSAVPAGKATRELLITN